MEELQEQITEKYKIWDVEAGKWFRPIYPSQSGGDKAKKETREIVFSQSGEMFLHHDSGIKLITHVTQAQFIPCLYSGLKDKSGVKIHTLDRIKHDTGEVHKIVFKDGSFCFEDEDGVAKRLSKTVCMFLTVINNICEDVREESV